MTRTITSAGVCVMLAMGASAAQAQVGPNFDPADWQYGPRGVAEGGVPIWNPVMQKIKNAEPIIGGTIRATDPRTYCSTAAAGYDFTWIEMQHEAMTWEQVSRMWLACPRPAVPGVRIGNDERSEIMNDRALSLLVRHSQAEILLIFVGDQQCTHDRRRLIWNLTQGVARKV